MQACGVCSGYSPLLRYGTTAPNAGLRIKAGQVVRLNERAQRKDLYVVSSSHFERSPPKRGLNRSKLRKTRPEVRTGVYTSVHRSQRLSAKTDRPLAESLFILAT